MASVELQEAVCVGFSCMAEKQLAVCAIPDGGAMLLAMIVAIVAAVDLIVSSHWEVGLAESLWS